MSYFDSRYVHVQHADAGYYRLKAAQIMDAVRALDPNFKPASFLDLGCGRGDLALGAAETFGLKAAGVELDETMARDAQARGKGEFRHGNVLDVVNDFRGRFDIVGSFELFEHLEPSAHARAFDVYRQYAAPGAVGCIMVPNAAHPLLGNWLSHSDYTHRSFFTAESLAQMLRGEGVSEACVIPWINAGSRALLGARRATTKWASGLFKLLVSTIATKPGSTDPFVEDAVPMSSHLIAVFKIPSANKNERKS